MPLFFKNSGTFFLLQDPTESLAVIGRYISENYNGAALHPIDFIDISTGQLVAEVMDPNITTISPVNKLHPRDDILASGSSRLFSTLSLVQWMPWQRNLFFFSITARPFVVEILQDDPISLLNWNIYILFCHASYRNYNASLQLILRPALVPMITTSFPQWHHAI
jgi:hypothetical protein